MAESLAEAGKVAQAMAGQAIGVSFTGGNFSFTFSSNSAESVKYVCITAVTLGTIYAGYKLMAKKMDSAVSRGLGGERDDQEIRSIKPNSLHVLLHCFTDQRLLEVLEDFECGTMKERLEKEFLEIGIELEGFKVQIDNIEEVKQRKEQILSSKKNIENVVENVDTNSDKNKAKPDEVDISDESKTDEFTDVYQHDMDKLQQRRDDQHRLLQSRLKRLGPDHVDVATSYNDLGLVYSKLGKLEEAQNYHRKALEIRKIQLGPNHIDVATSYNNLGVVYKDLTKFLLAEDCHKQALDIQSMQLGPNHVDVATSYDDLGLVYSKLGELEKAKNYHQQALEIRKTQLGPNHIDVATSYNNLGVVYRDLGELELAKDCHQQARNIQIEQLSPNLVDVATSYNNLGAVYRDLGELQQAKDYHQHALEIRKMQLGPNHIDAATSYNDLGAVYREMNELELAKNSHQRALEIQHKQLGPNHIDFATSYNNLGLVYYKSGKLEKAKDYHRQALEIRKNRLGPNHIDIATSYNNLGAVYRDLGEFELAKHYDRQALEIKSKQSGANPEEAQMITDKVSFHKVLHELEKIHKKAQMITHEPYVTENRESHLWLKVSKKHREKFVQLLEMLEKEPEAVKRISDNDVCFKEEFLIGRGSFCTEVYICLGSDGIERAIKRCPKRLCQKFLRNELDILTSNVVHSPRIANYWSYYSRNDFSYMILDIHEQNLEEYVKEESERISESHSRRMIRQMLEGLRALHTRKRRILHRNLKPTNILVDVNGDLVLSDFGNGLLEQGATSTSWVPYECIDWDSVSSSKAITERTRLFNWKEKSDVQVVGMLAFYIYTRGAHPFGPLKDRLNNMESGNAVGLAELSDPVVKDLLSLMLAREEDTRPYVEEALMHPYFLSPKDQMRFLEAVGNHPDLYQDGDLMRRLDNRDPAKPRSPLLENNWKDQIDSDDLDTLCEGGSTTPAEYDGGRYTHCLQLIRNVLQHPHGKFNRLLCKGGAKSLEEYFFQLFPCLPLVIHQILRKLPHWKEYPSLKEFFPVINRRTGSSED